MFQIYVKFFHLSLTGVNGIDLQKSKMNLGFYRNVSSSNIVKNCK